jgi:uncharacterized DUF497 family protein
MSKPSAQRGATVSELLAPDAAAEKLSAHGISVAEAQQLIDNRYEILPNKGRARHGRRKLRARRLVIGDTDGGRTLTLVIEQTNDPTSWLIVTGWRTPGKRRRIPKS